MVNGTEPIPSPPETDDHGLPVVRLNTIPIRLIIDKLVQQSYQDLAQVNEVLGTKAHHDGRILLAKYIQHTREQFLKLLIALRWARSAGRALQTSHNLIGFCKTQNDYFGRAVQGLHTLFLTLGQAKVRNYDVLTAVDVLGTGSYRRLPVIIREQYLPPDPLTSAEKHAVLAELSDVIRLRLLFRETVPPAMGQYRVAAGRVTFRVHGEFTLVLTLVDLEPTTAFHVVELQILVRADRKYAAFLPDRIDPRDTYHLHQLAQGLLLNLPGEGAVESDAPTSTAPATAAGTPVITAAGPLSDDPPGEDDAAPPPPPPLVRLYGALHIACLSFQLDTLFAQAIHLQKTRWESLLTVERDDLHSYVQIRYWPAAPLGRRMEYVPQTLARRLTQRDLGTLEGTDASFPPMPTRPAPHHVAPPFAATENRVRIVLVPTATATTDDSYGPMPGSSDTPTPGVATLQIQWLGNVGLPSPTCWETFDVYTKSSPTVAADDVAQGTFRPQFDPEQIDVESLVLQALAFHARLMLAHLRPTILSHGDSLQVRCTMINRPDTGYPVLHVDLAYQIRLVITVDVRTGRFTVAEIPTVVPSSTQSEEANGVTALNPKRLRDLESELNLVPARAAESLHHFHAAVLADRVEAAARQAGVTVNKHIQLNPLQLHSVVSQFPSELGPHGRPDTQPTLQKTVFLSLPRYPHHYVAVGVMRWPALADSSAHFYLALNLLHLTPVLSSSRPAPAAASPDAATAVITEYQLHSTRPLNFFAWLHRATGHIDRDAAATLDRPFGLTPQRLQALLELCFAKLMFSTVESHLETLGVGHTNHASVEPSQTVATPATYMAPADPLLVMPAVTLDRPSLLSLLDLDAAARQLAGDLLGDPVGLQLRPAAMAGGSHGEGSTPRCRVRLSLPVRTDTARRLLAAHYAHHRSDHDFTAPLLLQASPPTPPASPPAPDADTASYCAMTGTIHFETVPDDLTQFLPALAQRWARVAMLLRLAARFDQAVDPRNTKAQTPVDATTRAFVPHLEAFTLDTLVIRYLPHLICTVRWRAATSTHPAGYTLGLGADLPRRNPHRHTRAQLTDLLNATRELGPLLRILRSTAEVLTALDQLQTEDPLPSPLVERPADARTGVVGKDLDSIGPLATLRDLRPAHGRVLIVPRSAVRFHLIGWQRTSLDFHVLNADWVRVTAVAHPSTTIDSTVNGRDDCKSGTGAGSGNTPHLPAGSFRSQFQPTMATATAAPPTTSPAEARRVLAQFQTTLLGTATAAHRNLATLEPDTRKRSAVAAYFEAVQCPLVDRRLLPLSDGLLLSRGLAWYFLQRYHQFTKVAVEVADIGTTLRTTPELTN
ncbi:mediator complex subunit, partial [Tieghemiomyces parasiticus]